MSSTGPQGLRVIRDLPFIMGTLDHEQTFQGKKVDSGEQFGIFLKGTVTKMFGNKGYFRNFSREHGNIDPLGALSTRLFKKWFLIKKCVVFGNTPVVEKLLSRN